MENGISTRVLAVSLAMASIMFSSCQSIANKQEPRTTYEVPTQKESDVPSTQTPAPIEATERVIPKPSETLVVVVPTALISTLELPELALEIRFSSDYTLELNGEENRRGSFVSYDFTQPNGIAPPYLYEIQFFSEDSIREFNNQDCPIGYCFEGDYPDLDRFFGQMTALADENDWQDYSLREFSDRMYLVTNHPCAGDYCVIREYVTYLGDVKVDLWIYMIDQSQERPADKVFEGLLLRNLDA